MKNGRREKEGVEPRNGEGLPQQSGQMLEDGWEPGWLADAHGGGYVGRGGGRNAE